MSPTDDLRPTGLPEWLADPALARLWTTARRRLERNGVRAEGRLRLSDLTRAERRAVSGLLARPVVGDACIIDLASLDEVLARRSGIGGIVAVVAVVSGAPLRDRAHDRAVRSALRAAPLDRACELVRAPWAQEWVQSLATTGVLTGRPDAVEVVETAARVLGALAPKAGGSILEASPRTVSRVDLAASTAGDAHALDHDRVLHTVVLRALCAASGSRWPSSATDRRALWESFGVVSDSVSSTCLTLGLRAAGSDELPSRLELAAEEGAPIHLTAWDLRSWSGPAAERTGQRVLVCENPRVLEAVAQAHGGRVPVVCTSGEPNTVVAAVLGRLAASGAALLSHGDFDWPGIAIINRLVGRFGVAPWRMDAASYRAGMGHHGARLALWGSVVDACWDPGLTATMAEVGVAVHEEAVLSALLGDVGSWR